MELQTFLSNPEWDAPFFKRLARNDTGQAPGHQAGIVLPKELRQFLPELDDAATSPAMPTTDRVIRADMYQCQIYLTSGTVRYQYQTWGGTRSPESRLTDGLRPLRDQASEGDILLFQRRSDALDYYRLVLVRKMSSEFSAIMLLAEGRRWGPLSPEDPPVSQQDVITARQDISSEALRPFSAQSSHSVRHESRQRRIARCAVFRKQVRDQYSNRCAVSSITIATPTLFHEVESAHVVPVSELGTDDIRNGLALSQTLHWAFDRGLFGVLPDRSICIPKRVKQMEENAFLLQFEGRKIIEAKTPSLRVHADALRWHFDNKVKAWDRN